MRASSAKCVLGCFFLFVVVVVFISYCCAHKFVLKAKQSPNAIDFVPRVFFSSSTGFSVTKMIELDKTDWFVYDDNDDGGVLLLLLLVVM